MTRKRRTREHVIADLSVNHVERIALRCGFTLTRTSGSDYGIDLVVWTYTPTGEVENGDIKFQLKATDRLPVLADGRTISFRVDTADLVYWRGEPGPVILVVYDARADRAYWLDVRTWARGRPPAPADWQTGTARVRIPLANRLTVRAMRAFRAWKNDRTPPPAAGPAAG